MHEYFEIELGVRNIVLTAEGDGTSFGERMSVENKSRILPKDGEQSPESFGAVVEGIG